MRSFRDANGKIKKSWLITGIAIIAVVVIVGVVKALPKHLDGEYSHTTTFLFISSTDTLKFDGDKVIEYADGKKTNSGTYKISGDELKMKINGVNMAAKLSDDKKSFVVKSADGIASLAKGFKYTKN
ncbi:hypothetical protein JCM15457_1789 [Liquorilactobacillus sucicola DSM 21376 = JCM 15457]|uniref:Uncharacterized protein n=1 Tax=Liquorilactobacillus sucicola DSM 21376 = JCM 15457 TaxID=1423806 RepID=A0A023CY63_9LACO|nr:hypothetical protein [Liquorilactobacillus sucicola]KRN07533.1 hypothetical protein FD15_GL000816 [Liquorilactobacillus sucicola DSM 21376 = JCM 15457]GAJ26838.1 hypothetical protein JCM15457_1789 [Liquorilactobacillus sucicola DSM 21376 = JCM 15457]